MPAVIAPRPHPHTPKPRASAAPKKRRVAKRRGGARGELDSDDEIEREPATDDSDSDNGIDSLDSATDDSDTEPVSEDAIPSDRTHLPTPRNSKSPESVLKGTSASFFAPTSSWSDMVMDEGANGASELPEVDFADFRSSPLPRNKLIRKPKKSGKITLPSDSCASPTDPLIKEEGLPTADLTPSLVADTEKVSHNNRQALSGHSARQLYQQKLESDPSFVPTIGNFWGHDDRLLDTEFRNLSGWWRGRGMRRGRGRGDYGMRGRGGYIGRGRDGNSATVKEEDIPPVERTWTHDGFEEMKKRDEHRRADHTAARQAQSPPKRGGYAARGKGGFIPSRGLGGYIRGGFSPGRLHSNSSLNIAHRVRFIMKPELMWTKQHEAFLYFDTTLKSRSGHGAGFRVKLPGQQLQVIRALPTPLVPDKESDPKTTIKTDSGSTFVVRLPKLSGTEVVDVVASEKSGNTVEVTPNVGLESTPIAVEKLGATQPLTELPVPTTQPFHEVTEPAVQADEVPALSDLEWQTEMEQAVLHNPLSDADAAIQPATSSVVERPILPPLQTSFTPPPPPPPQPISQPSPAYGSPYGFALPPGIAMNSHGMPYELATGRPVFLQPPPMYNPRPMMHSHYSSMQLHHGHLHHHSLSNPSPDFLAPSASHTPPMNGFIDPATGTPIFAFPRQTSRVEIRAPGESSSASQVPATKVSAPRTPSNLRTTSSIFQPAALQLNSESSDRSAYYLQSTATSSSTLPSYEIQGSAGVEDPTTANGTMMMHYPQQYHHQQYYYPETYGYPQYMDVPGQTYDVYGMDQVPDSTVYY
jgi:hypothetical protein